MPPPGQADQSRGSCQECFRQADRLYAIGEFAQWVLTSLHIANIYITNILVSLQIMCWWVCILRVGELAYCVLVILHIQFDLNKLLFQPPVNEDGSVAPSPSLEFTKVEKISIYLKTLIYP